jgi:pimeloyl-ACP methyl ester carboxylesterase
VIAQKGSKQMKIASNGIHINVEDYGIGDVPLVFLHYWGGSTRTWRHIISELAQSHRTIALDHRGWGQSDSPPSGYGLADLAADAQGVIDALGLERYILVGHSMGGKVAQLLASRRPNGLIGLVLVAPSPPSPMKVPLEARQAMVIAYTTRDSIITTVEHVLTAKPLAPADLETVVSDSLKGAAPARMAWPLVASQEDITQQVGAIDVPTVVIVGELDRVDTVDTVRSEVMPLILGSTLHVLPEIGHLSMLESPKALAQVISSFTRSNDGLSPLSETPFC